MNENQYTPCLAKINDDWQSRWTAIRSVVSAWYKIELNPVNISHEPGNIPAENCPPSIMQWILFREEIHAKGQLSIIRDDFVAERICDPQAISLQVVSEGNVCWAVLDEHLHLEDPPVACLTGDCHGDYDHDVLFTNRWEYGWQSNETVSEFALDQVVHKLRGERGGCNIEVLETSTEIIDAMTEYSQQSTWFGDTCIFESQDMIATVRGRSLNLEIRGDFEFSDLPACVTRNINHGGAFHGILVP